MKLKIAVCGNQSRFSLSGIGTSARGTKARMHGLLYFLPRTSQQVFVAAALAAPLFLALYEFVGVQHTAGSEAKGTKVEPGFHVLFNGKDLTGWHKNPAKIGHGTGGRWTVAAGAISGEQDPPGSGNGFCSRTKSSGISKLFSTPNLTGGWILVSFCAVPKMANATRS